jgi:hypothetical protein
MKEENDTQRELPQVMSIVKVSNKVLGAIMEQHPMIPVQSMRIGAIPNATSHFSLSSSLSSGSTPIDVLVDQSTAYSPLTDTLPSPSFLSNYPLRSGGMKGATIFRQDFNNGDSHKVDLPRTHSFGTVLTAPSSKRPQTESELEFELEPCDLMQESQDAQRFSSRYNIGRTFSDIGRFVEGPTVCAHPGYALMEENGRVKDPLSGIHKSDESRTSSKLFPYSISLSPSAL